ncbi:hypothetical protein [Sphingomonas soli]|uniref:hypothetical protein n=1 Tax=Sphingomonas soli TaxID=266127 RepID=UPI00082BAEDE|nr:hypothetical protein [Sphingomonas soli]
MESRSLVAALRRVPAAWEAAAAVAVLIALGPLLTIAGAKLLLRPERAEIARLQADLAPRIAAEQAAQAAHVEMAAAVSRPPMGNTLEALARALPADATLLRAERTARGALDVEVTTIDPDRLRVAIRRAPELVGLRDNGQRQGDGAMIVSLHQEVQ